MLAAYSPRGETRTSVLALDGSDVMLEHARQRSARFGERARFARFRLEDAEWLDGLRGVRVFVSSLIVHHLDGPGKKALFRNLFERLEPGGAVLIADLVQASSPRAQQYMAESWDELVRPQSREMTGSLKAWDLFLQEEWNYYRHPDDPIDTPSTLWDQLVWLKEAGFEGVDAFWVCAGHALFGGYRSIATGCSCLSVGVGDR